MWVRVYGRKSRALGDHPTLDVLSHQLEPMARLAVSHGFEIGPEQVIGEIGSGELIAQRPRFKAMLDELEQHPPAGGGRIYVTELSRLSREDLEAVGRMIRIFREAGIQIHDRYELYDLTNGRHEAKVVKEAAENRLELWTFKVRVKEACDRNLRHGRIRNGAAPFGYQWSKDQQTLQPHPHRFPILQAACREILLCSIECIAQRYAINGRALHMALINPAICGWPAKYRHLAREDYLWPERENTSYPHACTREQWETIQRVLMERRKRQYKTVGTNGWCRDLVAWEGIGQGATVGTSPRRQSPGVPLYLPPRGTSGALAIPRSVVHEQAYRSIRDLLSDPDWAARCTTRYWQHVEESAPDRPLLEARAAVARQLTLLRRRYQEAVDAEDDPEPLWREALSARRKRLAGEVRQAETQLAAIDAEARAADVQQQALAALSEYAEDLDAVWPLLEDGGRRKVHKTVLAGG